jgi:DNA polymerase I-like protein with 3'-5' exonuclease and polymerase domains
MNYLVLDVETTISNKGNPFDNTNKLCMVGLYTEEQGIQIYDIEYSMDPYKESLTKIQEAIDKCDVLVGFNIKFDLHWLARYGITWENKRVWDCQLVEFILLNQIQTYPSLNSTAESYDIGTKLDEVKEVYWNNDIDTTEIPSEILIEYLTQDVVLTKEVMIKQKKELDKRPELIRLISLHNQDLLVLQEIEYNGLKFEYDWSITLGEELNEQIGKLDRKLNEYHDYNEFNPNSGDHLNALLYGGNIKTRVQVLIGQYKSGDKKGQDKYKWEESLVPLPRLFRPIPGTELSKEGFFSTDDKTLRSLKGNKKAMDLLKILLARSTLEKRRGTYYLGLTKLIDKMNWDKNIIHGQLNQCVTKTGRLSSSKPNLQNFDTEIKSLFTTTYGE